MSTIVMNLDEWEIAHEAHMLEEYSEEVKRAEWNPQAAPASEGLARINQGLNDRRSGTAPDLALPSGEEATETYALIPSTAFPQCP